MDSIYGQNNMSAFLSTDNSIFNKTLKNNLKSQVINNNDSLLLNNKSVFKSNRSVRIDQQEKSPKVMFVDSQIIKKKYDSKKQQFSTD